ncbi:MAG: hypothetical protein LBP82_00045 [Candidatus Methanoplasma sp.]|jgi:flagellar basal body-associated protein FliL|nr:hypothetical protein [Candidatus Methanoplasma sp.]
MKGSITIAMAVVIIIGVMVVAAIGVYLVEEEKSEEKTEEATINYNVQFYAVTDLRLFVYIDGIEVYQQEKVGQRAYDVIETYVVKTTKKERMVIVEAMAKDMYGHERGYRLTENVDINPGGEYDVQLIFQDPI